MSSRLPSRIFLLFISILQLWQFVFPRKKISNPKIIWVFHQLHLGDTIMLTGLLAKLRMHHPKAEIFMIGPPNFVQLYKEKPYKINYIPYNTRQVYSLISLFKLPRADWAIIPAENRYGWLIFSLRAKWITGFRENKTTYKNRVIDELIEMPTSKVAIPELMQSLVKGRNASPYSPKDWKIVNPTPFSLPNEPYVLLHVSAKSATKLWEAHKWIELIKYFKKKNINVVISSAPKENTTIEIIRKSIDVQAYQGNLTILQLTELMRKSMLIICLDNGVGQLTKIIGSPTICLFGSGSVELCGNADFWKNINFHGITKKDIICRNTKTLFNRELDWVNICNRSPSKCTQSEFICMKKISVIDVINTIECLKLLTGRNNA